MATKKAKPTTKAPHPSTAARERREAQGEKNKHVVTSIAGQPDAPAIPNRSGLMVPNPDKKIKSEDIIGIEKLQSGQPVTTDVGATLLADNQRDFAREGGAKTSAASGKGAGTAAGKSKEATAKEKDQERKDAETAEVKKTADAIKGKEQDAKPAE